MSDKIGATNIKLNRADISITENTLKWTVNKSTGRGALYSFGLRSFVTPVLLLSGFGDVALHSAFACATGIIVCVKTPLNAMRACASKPPLLDTWNFEAINLHAMHAFSSLFNTIFIAVETFFNGPQAPLSDFFAKSKEIEMIQAIQHQIVLEKSKSQSTGSTSAPKAREGRVPPPPPPMPPKTNPAGSKKLVPVMTDGVTKFPIDRSFSRTTSAATLTSELKDKICTPLKPIPPKTPAPIVEEEPLPAMFKRAQQQNLVLENDLTCSNLTLSEEWD